MTPRERCSNGRSRSTRTMPPRWRATLIPIWSTLISVDKSADRLRCENNRAGRPGSCARPRYHGGVYCEGLLPRQFAHRENEAVDVADAGLAVDPNYARLYAASSHRRNFARPFRTSQVRSAASDAAESARSENGCLDFPDRRCGTRTGSLRRRDRRMPQGNRSRFSKLTYRTPISPPPMRSKARWTRRSPPWRKPAASIPISRSNGLSRIRRTCRSRSKACARRGCRRSERHPSRRHWLGERLPSPQNE